MKKKYRNLFIGLGFPICSILALSMISCKKNEPSEDQPNNDKNEPSEDQPNNDAEGKLEPGWSYKSDTKPEEVNQFSIDHLQKLHFNYPNYKGNLVTLKADGEPTFNYPGPGTPPGSFSKEGVIPTEKHLELSKRVFSVTFNNSNDLIGTCWILDYKLTDDGSYPLTWYFGTNAHVLDDLKVENDTNYPEKFGKYDPNIFDQTSQIQGNYRTQNTRWIDLWKLNYETIKPNEIISNSVGSPDQFWTKTTVKMCDETKDTKWTGIFKEGYYLKNPPAKTIFTGNDFLTASPKDSSTNSFSNHEEYADFGVFELTFENEQQAREATNDYANWEKDKQFKYRESDLINNPENQTSKVYDLGFPQVGNSGAHASRTVSTNTNRILYDQGKTDPNQGLSKSQHYNTWTHTYGAFDGHIAMPWFGYNYEWVDNNASNSNPNNFSKKTRYATYGLIYGVNNGNMNAGSSGGLTIDENGYAIGVHFGSDNNAATGQSQAFYCGGYDYKGYYGNYNLPQYDLIRGGYPKQKNSYYDSLVKIYGKDPNFKTNLFPNGLTSRR